MSLLFHLPVFLASFFHCVFLFTFQIYKTTFYRMLESKGERHIKYLWELKQRKYEQRDYEPQNAFNWCCICARYVWNYFTFSFLIVKEIKLFYKTHSVYDVKYKAIRDQGGCFIDISILPIHVYWALIPCRYGFRFQDMEFDTVSKIHAFTKVTF